VVILHHELIPVIPVITIIFYWFEMSTLDVVGVVATLVWGVKIKSTVCLHHVVALTSTGSPSLVCVGKYFIYYEVDPYISASQTLYFNVI